jgi:hypothetical protein
VIKNPSETFDAIPLGNYFSPHLPIHRQKALFHRQSKVPKRLHQKSTLNNSSIDPLHYSPSGSGNIAAI